MGLVLRGGLPLIDRPGRGGGLERRGQAVGVDAQLFEDVSRDRGGNGVQDVARVGRAVTLIAQTADQVRGVSVRVDAGRALIESAVRRGVREQGGPAADDFGAQGLGRGGEAGVHLGVPFDRCSLLTGINVLLGRVGVKGMGRSGSVFCVSF